MKKRLLLICALLVSVITLSGAANRSFRTTMERWNPIGFTQAPSGSPITNRLTAGSAILPTVATAAPSGVLRDGSENVITFTTAKAVGEVISLEMEYSGAAPTLSGATGTPISGKSVTYRLTSQTVTITGDVTALYCYGNQLTALDVSKNTALTKLVCSNNQLTALDLSQNIALTKLYCSKNQLKALDLSHNTALTELNCSNNQLTALDISKNTALTLLLCYETQLTALDLSHNTALTTLECYTNQLTTLDVSKNTALTMLVCFDNQLTALDLSQNTALTTLNCNKNQLTALDVSKNTALTSLGCHKNKLTALDVSKNTALTTLSCSSNQLTALDVSKNTALQKLYCGINPLTTLDVSQNTALTELSCFNNQLSALDVSKNTALTELICSYNQLKALDVSQNTALTELYCFNNKLTKLDVSQNNALTGFVCCGNQIKGEEMTRLVNSLPDRTGKDAGRFIVVQEPAPEGNICLKSDVTIAKGKNWKTQKYNFDTEVSVAYEGANTIHNIMSFTTAKAVGEEISLYMEYSYSGDTPTLSGATGTPEIGERITYTLTSQTVTITGDVTNFDCSENQLTALDVSRNTALTRLDCNTNQLTTLDVSQNTALEKLYCFNNQLTALDVSKNTALIRLHCYNNQLTALDVSKNTALTELDCYNNQLKALDVSQNTELGSLNCRGNQIKGGEMTRLVNSLPDRTGKYLGFFTVVQSDAESNRCLKSDVAIAEGKNWHSFKYYSDTGKSFGYEGEEASSNTMSFTTAKVLGETVELRLDYTGSVPLLTGATGTPESGKRITYTLTSQTVTITGDVTYFDCSENQLTALDVSQNTALTELYCTNNPLTALDVSKNTALTNLSCSNNQLTALDLSQNTALAELYCFNNQLTALDVSRNTALTYLDCSGNQIKGEEMTRLVNSLPDRMGMDAGTFTVVQEPSPEGNRCLKTDVSIAKGKNWNTQKYNSDTHEYVAYEGEEASPNVITFTTAKADGEEISLYMVYSGDMPTLSGATGTPESGERITYTLTSQTVTITGDVTFLYCPENQLTALDVSKNTALTSLGCSGNQLTGLDVSKNTALTGLDCSDNQLTALDLSQNTALTGLACSDNQLTALDVSKNTALTELDCSYNQLTALDVSKNTELETLNCCGNQIKGEEMTSLVNGLPDRTGKAAGTFTVVQEPSPEGNRCLKTDVATAKGKNWNTLKYNSDTDDYVPFEGEEASSNVITFTTTKEVEETVLLRLDYTGSVPLLTGATGTPESGEWITYTLKSQTVTITGDVTYFDCSENQLTTLDVSKNTALTGLNCNKNQLKVLDVSQNSVLKGLICATNQLTALDVSKNTALTELECSENQLTTLDVSKNTALTELDCDNNKLTTLDVSQNIALTKLYCSKNQLKALDVSKNTALTELYCYNNQLTTLDVSQNTSLTWFSCSDNQLVALDLSKNTALTGLNCNKNQLKALDVSQNTALEMLFCSSNQLTALDVSKNTALTTLDCNKNQLTTLDVSKNTALTGLDCSRNQLTALDVAKNTALTQLYCYNNKLTALDVSKNTALTSLRCSNNQLTGLDVSKNTALTGLDCSSNQLTALDVAKNTALEWLYCYNNKLTALDVAKNTALTQLYCYNNQLTALDVSQNTALTHCDCSGNQIKGEEMTRLVNSLPDRTGKDDGIFIVVQEPAPEGNICLKSDVATAKGKNWYTLKYNSDTNEAVAYEGADATYRVTLTKEGEGTLKATGADDLNAVAYGTELTIVATPAEGYELKALTANGTDILATKKVVVKGATEVKATFAKKTFAVTLTKEGEGTIKAIGADNLNAVEYGTELTIEANPAKGYTLVALTANGTDILATKKFVVKGTTEVKATFAKKTFAVTLTKEGEGTINATGADNLNAVEYGTELTIEATPAEGYELTALTANGTDILATKKVVVKGATEVKATFAKKTFAVTLTKEGEGTLAATGADNLNAVEYGTELTIVATPADGYELKALTANGTDILATKKVVVKGATEVKATFAKKTFAVTLTKEGEGTLAATGADDLNAVPYGTELTIEATPAEGYELKALTANGADILATKKVVVKGATEVKATFTKKTFAVTLTKEGEGTLKATGADDLNAVPYGTELTIEATPAAGYELKALTANGTDILATKKVVVKGATEVKATFAKKTFAVTLTKEGEGTITATGAADLNAVPYGTELTIEATPAEGYELKALTANGADILATKKVVVKGATEVKATFAKKTFAVTLTKEGEGTLKVTGADDLNAVPYGTELTIEATPAAGYELKALTANGTDILATKKVVVKGATEIKASFTKKTAADVVNGSSVCLYPNPASTYVNVKGAKADALVRLYDANGTLQYEARTDADGTLQIDLSAYAEGTYLLRVGNDAQRLLIQR